jgi:hypothetical protein
LGRGGNGDRKREDGAGEQARKPETRHRTSFNDLEQFPGTPP